MALTAFTSDSGKSVVTFVLIHFETHKAAMNDFGYMWFAFC